MKKITALLICIAIIFSYSTVYATDINENITMQDIYSSTPKVVYTSDETMYVPRPGEKAARTYGTYPIYARVSIVRTSSSGLIQQDSQLGNYSSVASIALSFAKYAPAMKVSAILSVVGLIASQSTYTETRTFVSYVQYMKQGEARWADESSYNIYLLSGKRDFYKHILGATRNSSGQWTTKSYDYLSSPCKTETGNFYNYSDTWFKDQAKMRILNNSLLDDLPW